MAFSTSLILGFDNYAQARAKLVTGPGQMGNVGPISNFTIHVSIFFTKGLPFASTRGSRPPNRGPMPTGPPGPPLLA